MINNFHQTVTDALVEQIRGGIIRGQYRPGERLRLRDLADEFKISTMPVREALKALKKEGLVTGEPRKGVMVTKMSAAELEDVYEMRAALEAMATRLAAPHVPEQTFSRLDELVTQMDEHASESVKIVDLNFQFHATLYAVSKRTHLCEVIATLRHRVAHYMHSYMVVNGTMPPAQSEHRAIIEACRQRQAQRAAEIMHAHIMRAGQAIVARLQQEAT